MRMRRLLAALTCLVGPALAACGSDSGGGSSDATTTLDGTSGADTAGSDAADTGAVEDTGAIEDTGGEQDGADTVAIDTYTPPADRDEDGTPDDEDCEPDLATAHPGAVERAGNSVDDDCDGATDEAAIPATFQRTFAASAVGNDDESLQGAFNVRVQDVSGAVTDAVASVTRDGSTAMDGASVEWAPKLGQLVASFEVEPLDLRTENPVNLVFLVRAQIGDDTYEGPMDAFFSVTPDRVGLTEVGGVLYAVVPLPLAPRDGNSLYWNDGSLEYVAVDSEVQPGIWSWSATHDLSGLPYLFYFTQGSHPDTGAEAYFYEFSESSAGEGFRIVACGPSSGWLIVFETVDVDSDSDVDVDDIAGTDLSAFPVP
ncbi:MAG: hypothetical protein H6745_29480 [Deltaproteobacteria bacterium]|nr:hypothetical protein [Deltaproteobacteria bacterium]